MRHRLWLVGVLLAAAVPAAPAAAQEAHRGGAPAATPYDDGLRDGGTAADALGFPWGWAAKGLAGGVLAGPIGIIVVSSRAAKSGVEPAPGLKAAPGRDAAYVEGYEAGFAEGLRLRRREAAIVGGIIGTGILTYILLQALDFSGGGAGGTTPVPLPAT